MVNLSRLIVTTTFIVIYIHEVKEELIRPSGCHTIVNN